MAIGLHLSLATAFLSWAGLALPGAGESRLSPIAHATIAPAAPPAPAAAHAPFDQAAAPQEPDAMMGEETSPAALPETRTSPLHAPPSEPPVSVEPDNETIRRLLAAVTEASTQPADPRAREELLRHARILEQISNPEEVARMAEAIRNAFDAREFSGRATSRPAAGSVDFDQCVVADVTRVEDGDTVTIRETLTDPSGLDVLLLTSRTIDPRTGEATYRQELMEPGREPTVLSATQEEFDSASARYAPFELMNRFPLVRQLHRQAVVPLLGKFANSRPSKTPPTSLPATTSTTD